MGIPAACPVGAASATNSEAAREFRDGRGAATRTELSTLVTGAGEVDTAAGIERMLVVVIIWRREMRYGSKWYQYK